MARFPTIAFLSLALAASSGCSVLFVEGPPPDHAKQRYFDCTSSRAAQTTDMILGGVMALAALGAAQDPTAEGSAQLAVTGISVGLLGSALYGSVRTNSCREAKAKLMVRLDDSDTPVAPARPRVDPWLAGGPAPQASPQGWDAPPPNHKATMSTPAGQATPAVQPAPQTPTPRIQQVPPQAPPPPAP